MSSDQQLYDIAILGGGTGGYVSAIRAAQLGLSVVVIEENKVGGTCLHKGCMPSKAYLRTAEVFELMRRASEFGVETASSPTLNWLKAVERKNGVVQTLFAGVQGLLRKNKVQVVDGRGTIADNNGRLSVQVNGSNIQAKNVIIATGSRPINMGLTLDDKTVMTSDQAMDRSSLPQSVVIVGGGVIGLEWASIYKDCGADVTIVEALPRLLALEDEDISKEVRRLFEKKGIRIMTDTKVDFAGVLASSKNVIVPVTDPSGQQTVLSAESLLISIGRRPNVENIGIDSFNLPKSGPFLQVNGYQETGVPGLFAIGDVCGGGLAHVAAEQGVIAVEHIAGHNPKQYNPNVIPKCTYTHPEISSVGLTEQAAKDAGIDVQVGKFPFRAIGKSLIYGEYEGFAKIVTDKSNGTVIGVHLIGPHATDLISEPGLLVANGMNISELVHTVHAHPTLAEVFHEAGLAVLGRTIHL